MLRLLRSAVVGLVAMHVGAELPAQVLLASNRQGPTSGQSLLDRRAGLEVRDVSLTIALMRLAKESGVTVGFSPSLLQSDSRQVACPCASATVAEALDRLLAGLPARYEERAEQIVVTLVTPPRAFERMAPGRTTESFAPTTTSQRLPADSMVSGRVENDVTHQPITEARVSVVGGGRSAITDARGEFRLMLPGTGGTIEIAAIGYQRATRAVRAGETGVVIALARLATQLDEMVISGVAGGEQMRAQGNAVSRIDVATLQTLAPAKDVMTVISTSVPGMAIQSSGGAIGQGGVFRVRGASSMALNSAPILYVDGIRVNNAQGGGVPGSFGASAPGGDARFTPSRINDINPDDIESIEVVKGPAAATLYGTEATNGVIQITTKKGKAGRPRVEFTTRAGANWIPNPDGTFNSNYYRAADGTIKELNIIEHGRTVGFPQSIYGTCPKPYNKLNGTGNCVGDIFSTGGLASVGANIRGGTDAVRYFFSGDYGRDQGSVDYNSQNKFDTRGSLNWQSSDRLSVDMGLGFSRSRLRSPAANNQPVTAAINFACPSPGCEAGSSSGIRLDGPLHGFGGFLLPERAANDAEAYSDVNRTTANLTLIYRPASWWTHRLAVGGDFTLQTLSTISRRLEGAFRNGVAQPDGIRQLFDNNVSFYTFDYGTTANANIGAFGSASSFGVQYFGRNTNIFWVQSQSLALSALETIDAGTNRTSGEDVIQNKSMGMYFQEQVSWNKRLFLTAAVRGDDNSAFGKDFAFVVFPKVSASWVIGEESFFKVPTVSSAKLRAAWGKAGQQPDAFTAVQTFRPRAGETASGITTDNFGNLELKPEIGSEFEIGADIGLFNERLGLELNYYTKKTSDAIVASAIAPSTGFTGTRLQNLGGVQNRGWEVLANSQLYRGQKFGIDLRTTISHNANKVLSIGSASRIPLLFQQFHVPGYPLASFFFRKVVSSTVTNGVATNVLCEGGDVIPGTNTLSAGGGAPVPCAQAPEVFAGAPLPTWQGSTALTVSVGKSLQLYANVEYLGGNMQRNSEVSAAWATFGNGKAWLEGTDPILMGLRAIPFDSRAQWSALKMGYARLRELSATYTIPPRLARYMRASQASTTLSWSGNISTFWRQQPTLFGRHVTDPSIRENGNFRAGFPEGLAGNQQDAWPTMQRFVMTFRVVP